MLNARHSSATAEHFTPPAIVNAARTLLGGIDLDPASSATANRGIIRAERIYTAADDGLDKPWRGRVFLNPPGGKTDNKSNQKRWWQRLVTKYDAGLVTAAVFVCFSVELLQTTQVDPIGRLPLDFPICFPSRRVAYLKADGTPGGSPPHSSCIIYLPPLDGPPGAKSLVPYGQSLADLRRYFSFLGACR